MAHQRNGRRAATVAIAALAPLAIMAPAEAEHDVFTATGTISTGNPRHAGAIYYGVGGPPTRVTYTQARCDPASEYNGVDGYWVQVSGFDGHTATVTGEPDAQLDITFVTPECEWNGPLKAWPGPVVSPTRLGEQVTFDVPAYTGWVLVDLYYGYDEPFTLTVS